MKMIAQSLCRVLFSILILIGWTQPAAAAVLFQYVEVDSAVAGDCKAAGDLAGYGYPDLVGGMLGERLNWYRYQWGGIHQSLFSFPGENHALPG